jgi:PAS domain S-box-containing protein
MKAVTREVRRVVYPLVLVFCLLAAGIVTTGCFYYRNYERQFRAASEHQLSAVAELKVDELAQYRKERLWDAATLFKNPAFSSLVRRFLENPEDAEAPQQLQEWTAKYLATGQYDLVCLFDAQGVIRVAVPAERPPISSMVAQRIPEVLRSGQVAFQDFTRNEHDQQIYLTLLVPILDGPDHSQALGVLALRIDPETYLFPFIKHWPTARRTAETLLIRRDGNDALFLNELKFATNAALNLRISLANTNTPAVKAILGQTGIVEGTDYRGEPVLAALNAIPNSPWFLVARIDTAEVYAPLRERLRLTILFVGLLLVSAGLGMGAIWRHQSVRFYKERYQMTETLRRSEAKFRTLYDSTSDAVMLLDEKNFFDCNPATLAMFGCASREEFCSKHLADVSPPMQPDGTDSRTLANQRIATALEKGANHFEWMHKRADTGEIFTADVLLSAMELDGKPVLQAVVRDITERKRTEDALQNSRALYFSLVENLPQSIFRKDRDGRFQFVNERFCRGLKRSSKDIVGKTDADFFPPELARAYRKDDLRVMETGQILDQEEKHAGTAGRELFVHVIKTPLRDAQGQIIGVQGVFWDITDRKQAEEALRQEQTLMATLMENVPDAFYFKDAASRLLRANRALSRKFGLSDPAQLVGKSDADFFSGEHARQALADEQEIVRTGRPLLNVEEKETWMDGTVSWVLTTKLPLRDATGRIIGTCGISRDITERKRAEEALRESQALYHSLAEQLPIGVFRKDREGRYVLVNPFFCRLKGMKAEEFLGKTPREVAAVEAVKQGATAPATKYAAAGAEHHERIMQTGKPIELIEEYVNADGRKQFLHALKLPVTGPDGKIIGTQGVQFDITERKLAEETLVHERQLLRTLIDLLPETFYIKDLDGRFLVVNEALARQWGKENPSQMLGLSDADLFPAGLAAQFRAEELKVFAGEPVINRESICVYYDGRDHTVVTSKVPFRDSQGRIGGLVGIGHDITERKQATQRIADELNFNQTMLRASPVGIAVFKASGPCVSANETIAQIIGGSREEVLKHNFRQLKPWKDSGLLAAAEAALAAQAERNLETQIVTTFGRKAWFSCRFAPFHYEGEPHLLLTISDITGRKRSEEALKESEVRYHRISEAITDYIYTVRVADGRAVETTHGPACLVVTGYQVKDFANDPFLWLRMVAAEDRPKVEEQARRILAGEDPPPIEHRIVHKNGTERWVRNTFVPHRDEHGVLVAYDGLIQDITGRKQAEEALRWSETQLHVILESTADGLLAVDSKGKVIKASKRFAEFWRIPQSLMDAGDDRALLDFVLEQLSDPDAFLKKVQSLYGSDAVDMDTLAFKDGRIFERYSFPMMMDGAVIGRVWSFRDITERRRQEREISEKSTELERFTYTVSHDLKSPLVTVKTFLGYLEQDLLNPDAERIKQDVGYMRTAADKMGHLLDELLNLARVGRKTNPPVRVTFQQLAQEVVGLVAGRISTSRAEVQVADAAVVLEGDRPRLVEIWQNLVENACKFMADQPKPRIEIGVEQRGAETVFFVRDNGAGIEPRYQEKVFSLFEKLNPKIEGTGMGLALVKRVVELYKGRIWVESGGLGQGANFLFTLPAAVIIEAGQSS